MYPVHPVGAPPPHGSVLAVVVCVVIVTSGFALVTRRALRSSRQALRVCPVCAAMAIRTSVAEEVGGGLVRLELQCGQCGTWRRGLASGPEIETYERAHERDRRRIDAAAVRLVRRRAQRDLDAFAHALRSEVVGADDFLARARPALPRGEGMR